MTKKPSSATAPTDRMSAADYRKMIGASTGSAGSRRSGKYNAVGVRTEEGYFDSKTEYNRWLALKLLLRAGEIADLQRQVPYSLDAGGIHIAKYIADFVYTQDGKVVVEDSKGFKTPEYRQKKRLMKEIHGIEILETGLKTKSKISVKIMGG